MWVFEQGDRIIVEKSLYGVYDGKKGTVRRVIDERLIEVALDINKGTVGELTVIGADCIKIDPITIANVDKAEETSKGVKKTLGELSSIDDRMDNLEIILSKYGLSVKEGCGFMYIYDFLDTLGNAWGSFSEEDKREVSFCLIGEKIK